VEVFILKCKYYKVNRLLKCLIPILGFCLLVSGSACRKIPESPTIRFPYLWLDAQGYGGDIDQQKITEPSGICFHPSRHTLFVVSDEGKLAEITTDGAPLSNHRIPGDLEGITVDPHTGLLYIIHEGEDVILEFDADRKEVIRRFPINREFNGDPNFLQKQINSYDNGIEDITFVPDYNHPEGGTFYAGNQWDPPCILELYVPLKSSFEEVSEARILRVLPFRMDDPAAMYYDAEKEILNVVSDADNILVELTLDGELIREFAFPGDTQEGLARDNNGYLYIVQDSGGIIKVKDLR
jgi:uncharacterized protein YjiK